jgi:N-acetylglucosaminyl-diphospho-decaprenol L-rhamnosyltransferase
MSMRVAICIVSYRNGHEVVECVRALENSTYQDFEIVVCENGGNSAHAALVALLPTVLALGQRVTILNPGRNDGFASGINLCVAATPHADAWWLLNPDTEASIGALAALVARLREGCDAVGGTTYFENGRVQSHGGIWKSWLARAFSIGNGTLLERQVDRRLVENQLMYLSGASMLVGRRFIAAAGPMPEEFFLYCEEVDWCLRAIERELKLGFAPDAKVLHRQGTTTGNSRRRSTRSRLSVYLDERNKILVTRRHYPARLPVATAAAFLLLAMRYLRRGAIRQFVHGVAGIFAGLRGEYGKPPFSA